MGGDKMKLTCSTCGARIHTAENDTTVAHAELARHMATAHAKGKSELKDELLQETFDFLTKVLAGDGELTEAQALHAKIDAAF
jgi:hypothetical protein